MGITIRLHKGDSWKSPACEPFMLTPDVNDHFDVGLTSQEVEMFAPAGDSLAFQKLTERLAVLGTAENNRHSGA